MDKHRLALFSDGVYAIILTLLVLDLKPPLADGLAGLREIAPALAVHALSFMMVSAIWRAHFRVFLAKQVISDHVLKLNLLTLFWSTLTPFGARIAAEHPTGSLGAATICLSLAGSVAVLLRIFSIDQPESFSQPPMRAMARNFGISMAICASLVAAAAALCSVSPWIGYVVALATCAYSLTRSPSMALPHTADSALAELEQQAAPSA